MKRIISVLLTITILLGVTASIPLSVSAIYTDIYYPYPNPNIDTYTDCNGSTMIVEKFHNDTEWCYRIVGYQGSPKVVKIPNSLAGMPVVEIADEAFYYCTSLTSVEINNGVTSIGEAAFDMCTNLTSITIPNSVKSIGFYAFSSSAITSITIPDGVIAVDYGIFAGCRKLTSIKLPKSLIYIYDRAFVGCEALTEIDIPDSVKYIGASAFEGCTSLTNIKIPTGLTIDNIGISSSAFINCSSLTSVVFPDGLTSIGDYAFSGCSSLTDLVFPNSMEYISNNAFSYCNSLINITIPSNVTFIDSEAFIYCRSLNNIDVSLDNKKYSSIDGVLFDENQTKIVCYPAGKSSSDYIIVDTVTTVGKYAFAGSNNLKSITIPDNITTIESNAFSKCDSISDIYYTGTKSQWSNITINTGNNCLTNATIHYAEQIAGDINGDGETTLDDVIYSLKSIVSDKELTAEELASVDLNGDGKLSVVDVLMIQRSILEIPESA